MLQSTPLSTFSSTLPTMLSRTLLIALDGTLLLCLTVHSQISSQDALKMHSSTLPSTLPSTLSKGKTLPISLDYMLPCMLQVLDPETCWVAGARHREAGSGWRVAGGGRLVVLGGRYHDIGWYHSLNLIFSAATTMRSHDASWSWCWQLQPWILQKG